MAPRARPCHPSAGRAQDGVPKWEVAAILRLSGQTYGAAPPGPPPHHKVMPDLLVWRTAARGGHAEQGGQWGCERYASNSWRHRHCPQCQTRTKEPWLEARTAALREVPSCHGVLTLPHALTLRVLTNTRGLLTWLLRATRQTLVQFGPPKLGGQRGGLLLVHTWAQTLNAHFPVHALVPGGALADQGTRWVPPQARFWLPVQALGTVFCHKFLAALHASRETLVGTAPTAPLHTVQGLQRFLDSLYDKRWVV